ncbi:MAG: AtpZ/AtpI family protein [Clostridiales bacterium]|nr:AtpZ/AtpI family protein [Clostridiales bacterium]
MKQQDKRGEWFRLLKIAVQFTQLGLSLVIPLLLCLLAAGWLQRRFQLGNWILLVGLGLGLGTMGVTFYRFVRGILKDTKPKK